MLKKLWDSIHGFFSVPELPEHRASLRGTFAQIDSDPQEEAHRNNMEEWARVTYQSQADAAQANLRIMHRTMLVAFFALLVAIAAVVITIILKPATNVTVQRVIVERHQRP